MTMNHLHPRDVSAMHEPMYVQYAREFQRAALGGENKMLHRLNRSIVYYLGTYTCDLDFSPMEEGRELSEWRPRGAESCWNARKQVVAASKVAPYNGRQKSTLEIKSPSRHWLGWIPRLVLAIYLACSAYLLVALYYQYAYDFDLLRLRRLRRLTAAADEHQQTQLKEGALVDYASPTLQAKELAITTRMFDTKLALDILGSAYSHLTILVECYYLIILFLPLTCYMAPWLHYHFQRPFTQYHLVRDLLSRPREEARTRRMLERQVATYMKSSRVFLDNVHHCDTTTATIRNSQMLSCGSGGGGGYCAELDLSQGEQAPTDALVREMLAAGALTPLYRLPAWTARRTLLQFVYHLGLALYALVFNSFLTLGFLAQSHPEARAASRAAIQTVCLCMFFIAGPSVVCHGPVLGVVILEQIHYLKELRAMVAQCLHDNARLFARTRHETRLPSPPPPKGGATGVHHDHELRLRRTMNCNLLFVLLHYKIFVAQIVPLRRSLGFVIESSLILLLIIPGVTRLHAPYLGHLNEGRLTSGQLKIFAMAISVSVLVPVNVCSVPICSMFARCKSLYRDLSSLLAHMTEVKLRERAHQGRGAGAEQLYDAHAESCLAKELSDARRLLDQLTARAGVFSGTYTMLMKAHFWYGLILISLLAESGGDSSSSSGPVRGQELLSSLFSDPLGVYSQINRLV